MGQSIVDCCNGALQKLGAMRIQNLTDNSREARQCALALDANRRDELGAYSWNFAIKRVVLAPDATPPAFGFLYRFLLPGDCLKIIRPPVPNLDWVVEGNYLLSNCDNPGPSWLNVYPGGNTAGTGATSLNLRYVADITDPNLWAGPFYDVMQHAMAIDMCEPLTNSTSKKESLLRSYRDAVNEAKVANAFENTPQDAPDDDFWNCRY